MYAYHKTHTRALETSIKKSWIFLKSSGKPSTVVSYIYARARDNPSAWYDWKADSETIARNVEECFIKKGMKGATGGGEHPTYVYIFIK